MLRLVILTATGIAISGLSPADAAARQKHKVQSPAVTQTAPAVQPVTARRPAWAAPQQCFTDEGYGRFLPCEIGDGR